MSEKEIIEKVEEELEYGENCTYKYLLRQVLKLYQKEKEKNKKLKKENNALEIIHKSYKEMIEENNLISKDEIKFYYKKICASVNHFQSKNDNNIVLRIKEYLEELLEEN